MLHVACCITGRYFVHSLLLEMMFKSLDLNTPVVEEGDSESRDEARPASLGRGQPPITTRGKRRW